jgi:hypothetical protein
MKSKSELLSDYEHHNGQKNIWKFLFFCMLIGIIGVIFTSNTDNKSIVVIIGVGCLGLFGSLWNGEVTYLQRIKEEIVELESDENY